ncbi:Caprin homolog [Eumeta japonica]|uniref:Caprin homolog n=1 Tax=Eumeta variegata TaxID=151549 RepID=A0A4C1SUZ4_EUMVA|nr:Caprin homolog [Eumeta japonica]
MFPCNLSAKSSRNFSMTIDARPKQYGDTTFENVKRVFHRIQESDYLDKIYLTDVPEPEKVAVDIEHDVTVDVEDAPVTEANNQEQEIVVVDEKLDKLNLETPSVPEIPVDNNNVAILEHQQQQQQPIPPGHFNPTPVHAVEQNFFKHQSQHLHQQPPQPQQQYLQQMRPLADVIGSGNFYSSGHKPPPQQQQHQTQQQQPKATTNQQIFSPVQNQTMINPQQPQQSQLIMKAANETPQQPPANIMILNRLAGTGAPATPLMQQQQQGLYSSHK